MPNFIQKGKNRKENSPFYIYFYEHLRYLHTLYKKTKINCAIGRKKEKTHKKLDLLIYKIYNIKVINVKGRGIPTCTATVINIIFSEREEK